MIELEYKNYYNDNETFKENYFLITPNTLIEAIAEAISNTGLIITMNEAIELEKYKISALNELKKIINILADEMEYKQLKNIGLCSAIQSMPYIESVSYETQVYNVIRRDIINIMSIEVDNKNNLADFFCCGAIGND